MPYSPTPYCKIQGCPNRTVKNGLCSEHLKESTKQYDDRRGSPSKRGYNANWVKARHMFLNEHPFCVQCAEEGNPLNRADVVDHIIPHRGDYERFYNTDNWQALCIKHHNAKSARELNDLGKH